VDEWRSRDDATPGAPPASERSEEFGEDTWATITREGRVGDLAIVLPGGGARAAYQTGVLRCLAREIPQLRFPIITGVSAGAINAAFLASHAGSLAEATSALCETWGRLEVENIFRADPPSLSRLFTRWAARLVSGGTSMAPDVRGLVDTRPLYATIQRGSATVDGELIGIERNIERGRLKALALTALNYSTGQTVTWVQGAKFQPWSHPEHQSVPARITVDHVMASAALPMVFPAVRLGDSWFGDGGVRLTTPLAPALRLGATRILAISPRYEPSFAEADRRKVSGYPPPAQILSLLMDAIFLDVMDEDVRRLESMNPLIARLPVEEREGRRPVDIQVLRPSRNLAKIASEYEPRLPQAFRYLTRSLGTRETEGSDFLSMLMFQPDYLEKLIEIGEEDAAARLPEIRALVGG
jgi:NTE family protein